MLEKIKGADLVICTNEVKRKILNEITLEKLLLNIKFMTLKEFCNFYYGYWDEKALYFLMSNFKLNYDVALEYLNNILFNLPSLKKYYDALIKEGLIYKGSKLNYKKIVIIDYDVDDYIKKDLKNAFYIKLNRGNYKPTIYGFNKVYDEISYVASDICEKLKTISIDDIYLVNLPNEYKDDVRRIFNLFNIPINLNENYNIYGSETCFKFLDVLKKERNIKSALESIKHNEVYDKIIDILNKYAFIDSVSDAFISIIENELKKATISNKRFKHAVNIIDFSLINDGVYYLMGFNNSSYPKIYKNDQYMDDFIRKEKGIFTSFERFLNDKNRIINYITNFSNLIISFSLQDDFNTYYPSSLIDDLGLEVRYDLKKNYIYSNRFNREKLAIFLDSYYKYNEIGDDLELLVGNYDLPYNTYDNSFNNLKFEDVFRFLNGKLSLSYSSINNYFLCKFRFYISNVLKIDLFEESFMTLVGSLFHDCLAHMYDSDFHLFTRYNNFIKDMVLSSKERFFLKKLYLTISKIIDIIRMQEKYSTFNEVLCEQKIVIDKSNKLNVKFLGFVDKIKYKNSNGKMLCAIIDYKTGNVDTKLDNINYGMNLQLPVYIYLTKNGLHKDVVISGFYIQKIINNIVMDVTDYELEMENKLKLDGYSINDLDILNQFDSTYENSKVIKGMSLTKNGFSHYSKIVSIDGIDKINNLVDEKINEVISSVESGDFSINPKRIDGKLVGCQWCSFKDICYRKEEDIVDLEGVKFNQFIEN